MKKKIKSDKTCLECGYDPMEHLFMGKNMNLHKKKKLDRKLVKEYCEEQEMLYSNHKVKPIWRECCGILDHYQVALKDPKAGFPNYMK
jgi:hypothetical protein